MEEWWITEINSESFPTEMVVHSIIRQLHYWEVAHRIAENNLWGHPNFQVLLFGFDIDTVTNVIIPEVKKHFPEDEIKFESHKMDEFGVIKRHYNCLHPQELSLGKLVKHTSLNGL